MADVPQWRYYAAVAASGLSVFGWIAALVTGGAALYYSVVGGPVVQYSTYLLVALAGGIAFALLEKRLYRRERP
jgi:SNF family Na+-dependent transporter